MGEISKKPTVQELTSHLDRNIGNPIVRSAITGRVPFSAAVNKFYDASEYRASNFFSTTEVKFSDKSKAYGEIPGQLIEILSPFDGTSDESRRELDLERLQYGAVREDHPKFNRTNPKWRLISLAGLAGYVASLGYMVFIGFDVPEDFIAPVASSIASSCAFVYGGYKDAIEFLGSNPNFSEYHKLRGLGEKADRFLSSNYRMELIGRQFSDDGEKE